MTTTLATSVTRALSDAQALGLARLDAQLLLLHALGKPASDRAWLLAHDRDALAPRVTQAFNALVQRRQQGEPVAYLTGRKEFFGLELHVDKRVLVPRPDTETLVEWALAVLDDMATPSSPLGALDLGTGSGAVALAIRHSRPAVQVHATDFSADALAVAQANAQRLNINVHFSQGAWLHAVRDVSQRFHLIVSNPPYIAAQDPHLAALTHEPLQALASGADGLDDIRSIIDQAPERLHAGGWLLLEHGHDQATRVRALLHDAGFSAVQSRRDLGGIERCSGGRWLPGAT
jgi:release factor glutamine methyltransferase